MLSWAMEYGQVCPWLMSHSCHGDLIQSCGQSWTNRLPPLQGDSLEAGVGFCCGTLGARPGQLPSMKAAQESQVQRHPSSQPSCHCRSLCSCCSHETCLLTFPNVPFHSQPLSLCSRCSFYLEWPFPLRQVVRSLQHPAQKLPSKWGVLSQPSQVPPS